MVMGVGTYLSVMALGDDGRSVRLPTALQAVWTELTMDAATSTET